MTQRFWVIGYRLPGQEPVYFRGDGRYAIKLPALDRLGWVDEVENARLFVRPPDFGPESVSDTLDGSCIRIYPYEGEIGPNQVIRPTVRPSIYKNRYQKAGKEARKALTRPTRKKKDRKKKK